MMMDSFVSFIHPIYGQFADKYERNNKKGGVKSMKCFPTCTLINREHGRGTLCIDSVVASVDVLKISSLYFNYQPIDVIGIGRFVTDVDIMLNDKYFGDFTIYKEGMMYDQSLVTKLVRSKQSPFNPEIMSDLDNQNHLTFSSRGWHYGWSGGRYKVHQPHRFEVITFARPRSSSNSMYTCVGIVHSSNFELFSSRRADPNDKIRRRVSRGMLALNAAERYALQREEEMLQRLGNSVLSASTTTMLSVHGNQHESGEDEEDELSQSPDSQQEEDIDEEYDPHAKAGKRAAMEQYSKLIKRKNKKSKINQTNSDSTPTNHQQQQNTPKKSSPSSTNTNNHQDVQNILPISNHGMIDKKMFSKEENKMNSLTFMFPNPNSSNKNQLNDPASLAALMVLHQGSPSGSIRNQEALVGDILMNSIPTITSNPSSSSTSTANLSPIRFQGLNNTPLFISSPLVPNLSSTINPQGSLPNFSMINNNFNANLNEAYDPVDDLLNELGSLENAMGIELVSELPSETELIQPVSIPFSTQIYHQTDLQRERKSLLLKEEPAMNLPAMEKYTSPDANSSDGCAVSEQDDELFSRDLDLLELLGKVPPQIKSSKSTQLVQERTFVETTIIKQERNPAICEQLATKGTRSNPNDPIAVDGDCMQENNGKVVSTAVEEAVITAQPAAKSKRIQRLLRQYEAWNCVKIKFAQMRLKKLRIFKRKHSYFLPKNVSISF